MSRLLLTGHVSVTAELSFVVRYREHWFAAQRVPELLLFREDEMECSLDDAR